MIKLRITATLLFVFTLLASGQKYATNWGEITQAEKNLENYAKDPEAEAVVLFDKGDSRFVDGEGGFDIHFTRTRRIKILNESGLEYAEVSIPFYVEDASSRETVKGIMAVTYNFEDGKMQLVVDQLKLMP